MADVLRSYVDTADATQAEAELMAQRGIHSARLDRSEQPPHTPAGQIAEALQTAAGYRKSSQLYMPDGEPAQEDKDRARASIQKAQSIRLNQPS